MTNKHKMYNIKYVDIKTFTNLQECNNKLQKILKVISKSKKVTN